MTAMMNMTMIMLSMMVVSCLRDLSGSGKVSKAPDAPKAHTDHPRHVSTGLFSKKPCETLRGE